MSGPSGGLQTVTVVGASLSGVYAARALRAQGYDGRLVVVGAERHRPYDRPPLSKDFLLGKTDADALALTEADEESELGAEWLPGVPAAALDTARGAVVLADGREIRTDGVVIATGASAHRLPGTDRPLAGVHTLRTLDDADALRAELTAGSPRVVVVGAGFIGAEVAASCSALGLETTVVEAAPVPLAAVLGPQMGGALARLHAAGGVTLITGTCVAALHGLPHSRGKGPGRVTSVELTDGRLLPADVVVVGIGARPNTDWLDGSGLALRDGVVCDAGCATELPNIVAVGDVARVAGVRAEHWTSATEQPSVAVRNLLAGSTVERCGGLPYFWSDQYGARIQFAGRALPTDTVRIAEGDLDGGSFLATYQRDGRTTAVLAVNRPRPFMRLRRELARTAGSH